MATIKKKPAAPAATLDPIHPIKNVAHIAHMSMPGIYAAIAAGHLRSFLIGRRRMVRESAVRDWLDMLERASDAGKPVVYRPRVEG